VKSLQLQIFPRSQAAQCCAVVVTFCAFAAIAAVCDRAAKSATKSADGAPQRNHYRIEVDLDYHKASLDGREVVRFTNTTREDLESLNFNLYPNFGLSEEDQPSLTVQRVAANDRELRYSLRSRHASLRVELPQKLQSGQSIELTLDFSARIPRVQREETSLLAHFLQEVTDALNDERQPKDARDIFFAGEEAMMLGHFFPMLAQRTPQSIEQNTAVGVGNLVNSDAADYEVAVKTDESLTLIASADCAESKTLPSDYSVTGRRSLRTFRGERLRGFAVAVIERMKSAERKAGNARVVSYFHESDERIGKRSLEIAAGAIDAYTKSFGDYPYPLLNIVELPLAAGYSSIKFPALVAVAQAYYIDFDAPQAARLPGVLREQSDLIKSSFEFTIAHGVAKQWWGEAVGSDPERAPYFDEALANYSAAYYHEVAYGKKLGDLIIDQQLRGAYQAYRMLGGVDTEVDKPVKEFRNTLQHTAIVQAKGALLFVALRKELGDERFFKALQNYYSAHRFRVASPDHLRYAFQSVAENPRTVRALFQRWLREKRGDDDIGTPDLTLVPPPVSKIRALGRVFVKIGKTAAKPFEDRKELK
jgi:aminopeptidase N